MWVEMFTEVHGRVEEIRGRRGWTSPGEGRGNKTGKVDIAHRERRNPRSDTHWPSRPAEDIFVRARDGPRLA